MENNPYNNAINKPKNTLSGGSVYTASVGFYTASGCLMNIVPITPTSTILKVKDWKRRGDYTKNAEAYIRASQHIQKISPEDKLQEFFESKGIDKIDSDEYDKL